MITKQKRLKKIIIQEYKRHPEVFDVIEDHKDCKDPLEYNRIIIGDDIWKKNRMVRRAWDNNFNDFYYEQLIRNTIKNKLKVNVVSQCTECKKKGTRLNRTNDGRCKSCRETDVINHNAEIIEVEPDWIEKNEKYEPQEVIIINNHVPEELGRITQEVIDKYFPEFKGIYIHLTNSASGKSLYAWHIALNPNILQSHERSCNHTIGHELTHQLCTLQGVLRGRSEEVAYLYNQQIPNGELQCEMWTFARHPDLIANSYFSKQFSREESEELEKKYGTLTKEFHEKRDEINLNHFIKHRMKIHELSKQALIKRKEGMITYRRWFRDEMLKIGIEGCDPYHA